MKVVFLDIDGVLSPFGSDSDLAVLRPDYPRFSAAFYVPKAREFQKAHHMAHLDPYDYYIVMTFWRRRCCDLVRELLVKSGAGLVMHSAWTKIYQPNEMKGLLALADLDEFYVDNATGKSKKFAVRDYIKEHHLTDFVIIDDEDYWDFAKDYGPRFIQTRVFIQPDDVDRALAVLQG